ncbi:hypothetical protein AX14_010230 [Amanita brunnescens Koide BX004]|nr:hypothetical protein AX14_010230 [Amanita brunnescens Koide BX004]
MWRAEREKLKPQRTPLGLIEFVNNSDFSITMPLPVCDGAMKMAKGKEPFVMISGRTEKTVEKSMTVDSCMEYMNLHIRSDKQNQLKLRTEMIEMDKAIVRSARDKSATQPGAQILRKKLARESLYANLPLD